MTIAFFDFDKTLIAKNSAMLWIKTEYKEGRITKKQLLHAIFTITRYHLGSVNLHAVLRKSVSTLKGSEEAELKTRTQYFYQQKVQHLYRPLAQKNVEDHRLKGDHLVLLTTASNYLAEPVLQHLRLHAMLCNHFEVDTQGYFTGELVEPLCFGEGKLIKAKAYADKQKIALKDCHFYSDSMSDLPVFEAVGYPVAVNPDVRLKRYALKKGWKIEDWGNL